VRIRKVADRKASRPLLIVLKPRRMLKGTSGQNKLLSIVHRMSMELESKFLTLRESRPRLFRGTKVCVSRLVSSVLLNTKPSKLF